MINASASVTLSFIKFIDEDDDENNTSDEDDHELMCENADVTSFSREEQIKFAQRFEEGYDLYDPRYVEWLSIYHPDSTSNNETPTTTSCTFHSSSTCLPSVENIPEPASQLFSVSTPSREMLTEFSPTRLTYNQLTPTSTPSVTTLTNSGTQPSDSSGSLTGDTPKRSPLSELMNLPDIEKHKTVKTGSARVLTSNECLKAFKEKE